MTISNENEPSRVMSICLRQSRHDEEIPPGFAVPLALRQLCWQKGTSPLFSVMVLFISCCAHEPVFRQIDSWYSASGRDRFVHHMQTNRDTYQQTARCCQKDSPPGSEHFEDVLVLLIAVWFVLYCHPHLSKWPTLVTIPVASLTFSWISDLSVLQSSLDSPSVALIVMLFSVLVILVLLIAFLGYSEPQAMLPTAFILLLSGMYFALVFLVTHLDQVYGSKTRVHVHHWQIGLVIALSAGCFTNLAGAVLASIGLAVLVHGNAVYRLTSPFCGWRVPCSATLYSQVPNVIIN